MRASIIVILTVCCWFAGPAMAKTCNTDLGGAPKYSDVQRILDCLNKEIEELKRPVSNNSRRRAKTGSLGKVVGCVKAMPGDTVKYHSITESKSNGYTPVKNWRYCWQDGEVFLEVRALNENYVYISFPGLKEFRCNYNKRCRFKDNPDANFVIQPKKLAPDGRVNKAKIIVEITPKK